MDNQFTIWTILKLVGSLALLMYGMKSMSESLQKMAGPQLRHVLQSMTKNRFIGTITGAFVTASVQSSTATTVMTVSFVNAGLLTLVQAISIIMGANIGTTLTAWIMSAGFSFNITDFVWPAFCIGIILIYSKKREIVGDFIFGLSFLLLGLGTLKSTGSAIDFTQYPAVMSFFSSFGDNYSSYFLFLFIGGVLTFCVQSSAAIMAITMTLCGTGVLPIYLGIALVMARILVQPSPQTLLLLQPILRLDALLSLTSSSTVLVLFGCSSCSSHLSISYAPCGVILLTEQKRNLLPMLFFCHLFSLPSILVSTSSIQPFLYGSCL